MQNGESARCLALDINVNKNEPLFVNAAKKILNQGDVATLDFASRIAPRVDARGRERLRLRADRLDLTD